MCIHCAIFEYLRNIVKYQRARGKKKKQQQTLAYTYITNFNNQNARKITSFDRGNV